MTDGLVRPIRWAALDRVLVCDGAMGTMLHSAGVPLGRSVSELNLSQPRLVQDLHAAYLTAGADLLQTNTFDANRLRLAGSGLEDRVAEINIAGARLARESVRDGSRGALVAGSVGPARSAGMAPRAERDAALREQIAALADWVDVVLLETFGEIEALALAVEAARAECDVPIIAQMTFGDDGHTLRGEDPAAVAAALGALDVVAFGANCTIGPAVLHDVVAELAAGARVPIAAQPNAGTPRRIGNRLRYAHNADYFAEAAVRLVAAGASIVGGCCGTTPGHIRAVAKAVAELPAPQRAPGRARAEPRPSASLRDEPVRWPAHGRPIVVAGLRAPRGPEVARYLDTARMITAAGADMLAIVDPEPSTSRVSPVAAAVLLSERVATTVVLPVEAAGRTLAALQADLLGAHAFGLHTVVCRTGAPRYAGDYPDPGSSSDVDSLRLIAALRGLNDGVDWRGVPMPERTRFVIGASLHTSAADRHREVERIVAKAHAGVHFLLTDVVYDAARAHDMLLEVRSRGVTVPVLAAVAPFRDARTITRLTHETPELDIPPSVLAARDDGYDVVAATAELADKLLGEVSGILVHGPHEPDSRMATVIERLSAQCQTITENPAT
jgi:methionine synthase / methylenetetrahydrofolate reductase(NADPH)